MNHPDNKNYKMNRHFFEFDTLEKELEDLPSFHRVAFAAACCERMLPNYSAFCRMYDFGDATIPRKALDEVWEILQGKPVDPVKIDELIEECVREDVAPDSLDFGGASYKAIQVLEAICKTLTACLEPSTGEIVTVAERARSIIEFYVACEDESWNLTWEKDGKEKYLEAMASHPFAVIEMAKEAEDLQRLKEIETLNRDFLEWLRTSSHNNGKSLIDLS
jgi:uncharacterized protein